MRELVCKLSRNGGKSQKQICNEFTLRELNELLALESIEFKRNDKQDIKHASLMAMIGSISGNQQDPKTFIPDWGNEKAKQNKMTQEEYTEMQKSIALGAFGIDKDNKVVGRNIIAEKS